MKTISISEWIDLSGFRLQNDLEEQVIEDSCAC